MSSFFISFCFIIFLYLVDRMTRLFLIEEQTWRYQNKIWALIFKMLGCEYGLKCKYYLQIKQNRWSARSQNKLKHGKLMKDQWQKEWSLEKKLWKLLMYRFFKVETSFLIVYSATVLWFNLLPSSCGRDPDGLENPESKKRIQENYLLGKLHPQ